MLLTRMIASEVAGLRVEDIAGNRLIVRNSIVEGREKAQLKTAYRGREIPVTEAVRLRIDAARKGREDDPYVFCMRNGTRFDGNKFRENTWTTALKTAGMSYRVPYTLRHSFAAWALTLGVHPNRLVRLMGHGSKQMVYEVYGNYVEGLEADRDAIAAYFGPDFASSR
ncbi:MAG: tyrosine-type recombinase/integrase [Deltaproteobacteria bacterium]|nr:tyrosine-type recombinase/integrase [Deltaproteobacteria bacterium]